MSPEERAKEIERGAAELRFALAELKAARMVVDDIGNAENIDTFFGKVMGANDAGAPRDNALASFADAKALLGKLFDPVFKIVTEEARRFEDAVAMHDPEGPESKDPHDTFAGELKARADHLVEMALSGHNSDAYAQIYTQTSMSQVTPAGLTRGAGSSPADAASPTSLGDGQSGDSGGTEPSRSSPNDGASPGRPPSSANGGGPSSS